MKTSSLPFSSVSPGVDLACPVGLDCFCDWLTAYQDHAEGGLPVLNDGYAVRFGPEALKRAICQDTGELRTFFNASEAEYTVSRRI